MFTLDENSRDIIFEGKHTIHLSKLQMEVWKMIFNAGKPISGLTIAAEIGETYHEVISHISAIRQKFEKKNIPFPIKTVWGEGYEWRPKKPKGKESFN